LRILRKNMIKMSRKIFICLVFVFFMGGVSAEVINVSELGVREKVSQMVIIKANDFDSRYSDIGIGGVLFGERDSKEEYKKIISDYQNKSRIKLFISADLEGYWNPFVSFYKSKNFGEVKDRDEAFSLGKEHGEILKELGFNLDFSPVVEKRNTVWPGRSFTGSDEDIRGKIVGYIEGLEGEGILSTAKHYPGGSMVKDPHIWRVKSEVFEDELSFFDSAINSGVSAVMVGHPVVYGAIDSKGSPVSVSYDAINPLREKFDGLIISDAITMWGLRKNYLFSFNRVYIDLINAGNDVIIDTNLWFSPWTSKYSMVKKRIDNAVKAVERGEISEQRIDESVSRILQAKGYNVVT